MIAADDLADAAEKIVKAVKDSRECKREIEYRNFVDWNSGLRAPDVSTALVELRDLDCAAMNEI